MPVLLKIEELEPGMVLAEKVVNGVSVLMQRDKVLEEKDISLLTKRFPDLEVRIIDPLLDERISFQNDSLDQDISFTVRVKALSTINKMDTTIRTKTGLDEKNCAAFIKSVSEMVAWIQTNHIKTAILPISKTYEEHRANVFFLAVAIGAFSRNHIRNERYRLSVAKKIWNVMDLKPLATAALLQDVGMVPIKHLLAKQDLNEDEAEMIKMHPIRGAEMIPDTIHSLVRQAVKMHHENVNGTGYPAGIPGDKVNVLAKVVRVADAYCSTIAPEVFKKIKSPFETLYEMLFGQYKVFYDPAILRILARVVQPFQIGARIKINTMETAVITKHDLENPFNPQMVIAYNKEGRKLTGDELQPAFFINDREDILFKTCDGQDITYLNDVPHHEFKSEEEAAVITK